MKLKKRVPVIDQGNSLGFWGGKFGGNFVPETLKKPIEDLEVLFNKLKKEFQLSIKEIHLDFGVVNLEETLFPKL